VKKAEAEGKKAVAEAEGKKAEAEGKKAVAEAEVKKAEVEAEGKKAVAEAEAEGKKAVAVVEAEGKKAVAEAEVKKAVVEAEGKKAVAEAGVKKAIAEAGVKKTESCKVVISYDALGVKTKLAEKMVEFHLAGTIARLPRPDSSKEYDTELIFEGTKQNVEKMKKYLEEEKYEAISTEVEFNNVDNIRISQTPSIFHRCGSSGGKETIFHFDPDESTTQKSGTSRNSVVQQNFTSALLLRDFRGNKENATCLMCECKTVQGAHIYPLNRSSLTTPLFNVSTLNNVNDTRNGILLCGSCHRHFDNGLCGFDINWRVTIEEALKQVSEYAQLEGRQVNVGDGLESPLQSLMQVQRDFCVEQRRKRHDIADNYVSCEQCNRHWKRVSSLVEHKCRPIQSALLVTPPKSRIPETTVLNGEELTAGELEDAKLESVESDVDASGKSE